MNKPQVFTSSKRQTLHGTRSVTIMRTAFVLADWQLPTQTHAATDAPLVFQQEPTSLDAPFIFSREAPSTTPSQAPNPRYVPVGNNRLPDAVPVVFMGSAFVVQDPQWMLRPVEQYLRSPAIARQHTSLTSLVHHMITRMVHNIRANDQGVSNLVLNDDHGRIRVFLRHEDAAQEAARQYGAHGDGLTISSLIKLSISTTAHAAQAACTAHLFDQMAREYPWHFKVMRVLGGNWVPVQLASKWSEDTYNGALQEVVASPNAISAWITFLRTMAATRIANYRKNKPFWRLGNTDDQWSSDVKVQCSIPGMSDNQQATAESLREEWVMLSGKGHTILAPNTPPHPQCAPGLLEHRIFSMPLQAAITGCLCPDGDKSNTRVPCMAIDGVQRADANKAKGDYVVRMLNARMLDDDADDHEQAAAQHGVPAALANILLPAQVKAPAAPPTTWSPGWHVLAGLLGIALPHGKPRNTDSTATTQSSKPASSETSTCSKECMDLPVWRVPGLVFEHRVGGGNVVYVPLFLSMTEARHAWTLLQPYVAQLVLNQRDGQRRKRLKSMLFSIARAAGAGPSIGAAGGSSGMGGGNAEDDEGDLEDPPEIQEFSKELGELGDDLGAMPMEMSSGTNATMSPVSTIAAGVLSSVAAAWHAVGDATDKVLYGTHLGRGLLLPRLYPTPVLLGSTYSSQVHAIAEHNAAICRADTQVIATQDVALQHSSSPSATTQPPTQTSPTQILHLLERIGTLPTPCFNPYKNAMPISPKETYTLHRVPITYEVLPSEEDSKLTGVADERMADSQRKWRLRINVEAMMQHTKYPHLHELVGRSKSMSSVSQAEGQLSTVGSAVVADDLGADNAPQGVMLVGDLGMYMRPSTRRSDNTELPSSVPAAGPLMPVLGGHRAWWRAPPVLMAPTVPLGMGPLPVVVGRNKTSSDVYS